MTFLLQIVIRLLFEYGIFGSA